MISLAQSPEEASATLERDITFLRAVMRFEREARHLMPINRLPPIDVNRWLDFLSELRDAMNEFGYCKRCSGFRDCECNEPSCPN